MKFSKNEISVDDFKMCAFPKKKWMGQKIRPRKDLMKTLDNVFSQFIRLRDSDSNGYCRCITCDKLIYWKELDCGHFVTRDKKIVRYDERNCHAQCKYCNNYHKGEQALHAIKINDIYGPGTAEKLIEMGRIKTKLSEEYLLFNIAKYRDKIKIMKNSKQMC